MVKIHTSSVTWGNPEQFRNVLGTDNVQRKWLHTTDWERGRGQTEQGQQKAPCQELLTANSWEEQKRASHTMQGKKHPELRQEIQKLSLWCTDTAQHCSKEAVTSRKKNLLKKLLCCTQIEMDSSFLHSSSKQINVCCYLHISNSSSLLDEKCRAWLKNMRSKGTSGTHRSAALLGWDPKHILKTQQRYAEKTPNVWNRLRSWTWILKSVTTMC